MSHIACVYIYIRHHSAERSQRRQFAAATTSSACIVVRPRHGMLSLSYSALLQQWTVGGIAWLACGPLHEFLIRAAWWDARQYTAIVQHTEVLQYHPLSQLLLRICVALGTNNCNSYNITCRNCCAAVCLSGCPDNSPPPASSLPDRNPSDYG